MSLVSDYAAFIESERESMSLLPCTADADYALMCHVTNVNAAYNGSCARCEFGGTVSPKEDTNA